MEGSANVGEFLKIPSKGSAAAGSAARPPRTLHFTVGRAPPATGSVALGVHFRQLRGALERVGDLQVELGQLRFGRFSGWVGANRQGVFVSLTPWKRASADLSVWR